MDRSRSRVICGCLTGLFLLFAAGAIGPVPAVADPTTQPAPNSSTSYRLGPSEFSLLVSPARLALTEADLHSTQQVTVVNRGQEALTLVVQKRNFTAAADGTPRFDPDAPYAAAAWLSVDPERFSLAPGASRIVSMTIKAPEHPDAGDHQVALVFLAPSQGPEGNIRLNRGVAVPIYITAPGPVDDSVQLVGLNGTKLSVGGNVAVTATLQNTGNTHRDFRGSNALTVISAGHDARFGDFTVPRGAHRVIMTPWRPPLLCVCRPTVTFTNRGGAVQTASMQVVVFPWWLAAALVLGLAIGGVLLIRSRHHRSRPARAAVGVSPPAPVDARGDG